MPSLEWAIGWARVAKSVVMATIKQIGILVLLAGLAAGGYVGWQEIFGSQADARHDAGGAPRKRSVIVETQVAEYRDLETLVDAIGSTRARRAVDITPMADGRVVAISFRAGQSVEGGEPLLRLDDDIQRADLAEARARVTAAEKALDRARGLRKTSSVAVATIDTLTAELAAAQADRNRAARRLRDRTVVAPFAGIVGFSNVELGARIEEGDTVTTLDDLSVLEVELSLPESLFGRIEPGMDVVTRGVQKVRDGSLVRRAAPAAKPPAAGARRDERAAATGRPARGTANDRAAVR